MLSLQSIMFPSAVGVGALALSVNQPKYQVEIRMKKLSGLVSHLKSEFVSRKFQLKARINEDEVEFNEIGEELKDLKDELLDVEEKRDVMAIEWKFVEDESFWRSIHRKHVMEDLKDLKKRQKKCFTSCKDILVNELEEPNKHHQESNKQPISPSKRIKQFFAGLFRHSPSQRSKERQNRRNSKFQELITAFDESVAMVDELAVKQYHTYVMIPRHKNF